MGNIIQQSGLGVDQIFQAFRHAVEIAHQFGDFVSAAAAYSSCACGQITRGQLLCGFPQPHYRRGQITGKQEANQSRRENRNENSQARRSVWTEKEMRRGRALDHQGVTFPAWSDNRLSGSAIPF